MYTIVSNASGTRTMQISDENLDTIEKYSLFRNLVDSNGIVDDSVLEKLRLNARALVESTNASDEALLRLSFEVLNHPNMKPTALHNLILLYTEKKG
jgi:hypothetical protein